MVQYNFGAPSVDFSSLGRLGETYDRSVRRTREAEVAANRERALASFGQNSDLAALGTTLLRAGDLEGGMQALRLHASQEGTPYQRSRAAAEDARYEQQRADQQAERDRQEANRRETLERADRPQRVTEPGVNEFGDATRRQGWQYPNGVIKWEDGTETRAAPGPQSGGAGDPNLPSTGGIPAQSMIPGPQAPDYGYVLPGASGGQYMPMGTVLPPKGDAAVAAPPPAALPIAPPAEAGRTAVAAPPVAQAAPTAAPVAGPPITSTMINQGTSNIAPMTNAEMIAEARRIGISPGQYREARANAIKKEMEAKTTGGGALTESQANARLYAGKMEGAEKEFRPNEDETYSVGQRVLDNLLPGHASNFITSEKYQAGQNAKREWVAALLRKTSGAAVTDEEFGQYNEIYFPQVGEGKNVAAQKARARERALEGIKAGLPAGTVQKMDEGVGGRPLGAAPGQAGDLKSGGSITTKSGIKATW